VSEDKTIKLSVGEIKLKRLKTAHALAIVKFGRILLQEGIPLDVIERAYREPEQRFELVLAIANLLTAPVGDVDEESRVGRNLNKLLGMITGLSDEQISELETNDFFMLLTAIAEQEAETVLGELTRTMIFIISRRLGIQLSEKLQGLMEIIRHALHTPAGRSSFDTTASPGGMGNGGSMNSSTPSTESSDGPEIRSSKRSGPTSASFLLPDPASASGS